MSEYDRDLDIHDNTFLYSKTVSSNSATLACREEGVLEILFSFHQWVNASMIKYVLEVHMQCHGIDLSRSVDGVYFRPTLLNLITVQNRTAIEIQLIWARQISFFYSSLLRPVFLLVSMSEGQLSKDSDTTHRARLEA